MSKEIKNINSKIIIIGNDKPPRNGAFEVLFNGKLVFSKLSSGDFPTHTDILSWF